MQQSRGNHKSELRAAESGVLLSAVADGVLGLDRRGYIRYVNAAGASLLGYEPAEMIGRALQSFVQQPIRRKDGTQVFVDYTIKPLSPASRAVSAVATLRDVTA